MPHPDITFDITLTSLWGTSDGVHEFDITFTLDYFAPPHFRHQCTLHHWGTCGNILDRQYSAAPILHRKQSQENNILKVIS